MRSSYRALGRSLDLRLSEVLRVDLAVGFALGGVGGGLLAWLHPEGLPRVVTLVAALVGVVIGAVLAGIALLVAFLDAPFLRKLHAIERKPSYFLGPFVFTVMLGVLAGLLLVVLAALPIDVHEGVRIILTALAGLLSVWALTSLVPALATLVEFVDIQQTAAMIPDDVAAPKRPDFNPPPDGGTDLADVFARARRDRGQ